MAEFGAAMITTVRVGMSTLHLHSTLAQIPVQYTSLQFRVWLTNTAKFLKASTSLSCINSGPMQYGQAHVMLYSTQMVIASAGDHSSQCSCIAMRVHWLEKLATAEMCRLLSSARAFQMSFISLIQLLLQ